MARPGLMRNRKFIRLARLLGSEATARGHLEIIWEASYEAGNALLGDADDVEYLARWTGEKGRLAAFLLEAGFLDLLDSKNYSVHDLFDHAPDYVRRRMEREKERISKGKSLTELRSKAGRKGGKAKKSKQTEANDQQTVANEIHLLPASVAKVRTPSPSPSPSPSKEEINNVSQNSNSKPSIEQVRAYCLERNNGIDADAWFDYYTANGWKVGKNAMKDWKASVRTWERNKIGPHAHADPPPICKPVTLEEAKKINSSFPNARPIPTNFD